MYISHYTMPEKQRPLNCLLIVLMLQSEISKIQQYFLVVFNKKIVPLTLVGYAMIIATWRHALRWLSIISYPTRVRGIIVEYK